jgi:hypothetical protein
VNDEMGRNRLSSILKVRSHYLPNFKSANRCMTRSLCVA